MENSFSLLAGWVIDGTGGPVRHDVLLRVEDGLIASMRRVRPDDVRGLDSPVADFSRCTVVPGLIDCHVHLSMSGICDEVARIRQLSLQFEQAKQAISEHIGGQLSHGVVALRDGGDPLGHTLRYRHEQLPLDGYPVLVKSPGRAWRARGRYGRVIGRPPAEGSTLAQSIAGLDGRRDHLKIVNSGLNSLTVLGKETLPQFSQEDMDAAVQAGRKLGLKCMVHANGKLPVRQAVDAGCHSIEHGFFMGRENIRRMADLQVFWVPTAFTMKAYSRVLPAGSLESETARKTLENQLEQIAYARELGVPIAVGTDCGSPGVNHGEAISEEIRLFVEAGFSIEEAVLCATLEGARLLGLRNELGQLKKGMPATFVVAEGDPSTLLDALGRPKRVYVRGKVAVS